jgi:putative long chain acyl-CoA synthase
MDPAGLVRRALASTRNALDILSAGRLGQPYGAPHEVIDQGPHHRLRRYATCARDDGPVALMVPPLMVTSEVYDIDAELSAVVALGRLGVRPFVIDFGAPEREEGGVERTLDDHVVATARCIERVRALTGRDVHVCGYSQGGMFAYQAAAFVRSVGVASVVTFGSPVDLHKSLPAVHRDATGALLRLLDPVTAKLFAHIEALPGALTSTGFKVLSGRKEIAARIDFLRNLHDRGALVRREARRRFLGGDGFVAWPGPAFRAFVEQFVVHNRMLSGGFVLDGRTVSLADITRPILAFIGTHDELARPAAVRAITQAAPGAAVSFVPVRAGHFGLVVGSTAVRLTWPTVAAWMLHHDGLGELPEILRAPAPARRDDEPEEGGFDVDLGDLAVDALTDVARTLWHRVGDVAASATDAYDSVRYQEPRLRALALMTRDTPVGASALLRQRAREIPDATCFLWRGRAFTYAVADARVDNVVKGLWACGVRPGDRVGVVMRSRPSLLTALIALNRLGAVPALAPPSADADALRAAFASLGARRAIVDPEHTRDLAPEVLVLGGGGARRDLGPAVVDMEAIDPAAVALPSDVGRDAMRAGELAMILLRPGESGALRAAPVTGHRVALSALGAAAACTITPEDTVYCAIPLHHPTGVLACVGAAFAGGARLALAERFDADAFFPEARRYGATVVFYAGEMLRPLAHAAPSKGERDHAVRLVAGSGMRADLWEKLRARYGFGVMEFYASTTQRVIAANASGEKVGALGKRMPGGVEAMVARVALATGELARDEAGLVVRAAIDEPGVLLARVDDDDAVGDRGVVRDVVATGDRWRASSDVLRVDADGDLWFVDALSGFVHTAEGAVSTRRVEDALYALPEVEQAAAWGEGDIVRAAVSPAGVSDERIAEALGALEAWERPVSVARVAEIPMTEGYRPDKRALREGMR